MRFSARLEPDLTPGRLGRALETLRAAGAPLLDLTCSNPPECGLGPSAQDLAAAVAVPEIAEYQPHPRGLRAACREVADYYAERGLPTQPEQIFLSASTSQSYAELIKLFADPGDDILVPQPSYPLFDMLVQLEGCRPVPFLSHGDAEAGWQVDLAALEKAFTSRTRVLILVSPNNPTGAYVSTEEFATVQRLCVSRGCPLLVDEVFHDYPAPSVTAPRYPDEEAGLTVRLSGLSKVIGAPQLKLGWVRLGGEEALVREAAARLEFIADTYLSASTPAQLAARALLPARAPIQAAIQERLQTNQRAAQGVFGSAARARLLPREGGWYLVLRLPDGEDEQALAHELLVKDRVVVHPGYFYDFPEAEHLVFSLIPRPEQFAEGVRRVAGRLATRSPSPCQGG